MAHTHTHTRTLTVAAQKPLSLIGKDAGCRMAGLLIGGMLLRRGHKNNNDATAWCQRGRRQAAGSCSKEAGSCT